MKRIILASLVVSSTILMTSPAQAWNGNWLFGGSVGYGESNGSLDSNIAYLNPAGFAAQVANASKSTSFHNNGWLVGLFGGYQALCNNWLVGLELGLDWYDDYNAQNFAVLATPQPGFGAGVGYQGTAYFKHDIAVDLSARFGYAVSEYLIPYIRLGIEGSRDHLDVSYVGPVGFDAGNTAFAGYVSEANTKYRFLGGIGLEIPLCSLAKTDNFMRGLSLRAEYNYHGRHRNLSGQSISLDSLNAPALTDHQYSAAYRSDFNTGKVSLVWNFG